MSVLLKIADGHYISSDEVREIRYDGGSIFVDCPDFSTSVTCNSTIEFENALATLMAQYMRRRG